MIMFKNSYQIFDFETELFLFVETENKIVNFQEHTALPQDTIQAINYVTNSWCLAITRYVIQQYEGIYTC